MSKITIESSEGAPNGMYQIISYDYSKATKSAPARFVRQAGVDTGCGLRYTENLRVAKNEVAVCDCQSQPGGLIHFGSAEVQAAWNNPRVTR